MKDFKEKINNKVHCPVCGNGRGVLTGKLGRMAHYRCGDCGYKFSNAITANSNFKIIIGYREEDNLINNYKQVVDNLNTVGLVDEINRLKEVMQQLESSLKSLEKTVKSQSYKKIIKAKTIRAEFDRKQLHYIQLMKKKMQKDMMKEEIAKLLKEISGIADAIKLLDKVKEIPQMPSVLETEEYPTI